MLFRKKKPTVVKTYDKDRLVPAIRCSICTGEEVAGFQELETGRFHEERLLQSPADLEEFKRGYGIDTVKRIY